MTEGSNRALWAIPAPQRSWRSVFRPKHAIAFTVFFNLGMIFIASFMFLFYPLSLLPLPTLNGWFEHVVVAHAQKSFGRLCVLVVQLFAPTSFVVLRGEGVPEDWVIRDAATGSTRIVLPNHGIWMANHQTLSDWLYIWTFSHFTGHSSSILITLKASIKAVAVIGWACTLFGFIFLDRNWLKDKPNVERQLEKTAKKLQKREVKLALLVFPEGTLITGNTKPFSQKFAEKNGIQDNELTLLPRSTGLYHILTSLSKTLPSLSVVDLTLHYPGPSLPYGPYWPEDYTSLTAFFTGISPPRIVVFVRAWKVSEIPLDDQGVFENWLRERWREKDSWLAEQYKNARRPSEGIEIPIKLDEWWEGLAAVLWCWPVLVYGCWLVLRR